MKLDQRGETLVEVVMALGILSLVLVSSYALATGTFRLGRGAGERTQAVNYLQEQVEALRTYRNNTAWDPDFINSMAMYGDKTFCMQPATNTVTDQKVWLPNTTDCVRDNIAITITAKAAVTGGVINQQYNYELVATWKTGAQDNSVRLTTKLVRQR